MAVERNRRLIHWIRFWAQWKETK